MLFEIQLFADEAGVDTADIGQTGAGVNPDAGDTTQSTPEATEDKGEAFEKLIRGEYKEEYSKRVSEIVKKRLKNAKDPNRKLSAPQSQPTEEATETAQGTLEGNADQLQNDANGEQLQGQEDEALLELGYQLSKTLGSYPNFNLKTELNNPLFRTLLSIPGVDMKKAFEVCHHDEILVSAMEYATQNAKLKLAESTASGMSRPNEAFVGKNSCVKIEDNPRELTKAQRADIKKRVRRGEKIIW